MTTEIKDERLERDKLILDLFKEIHDKITRIDKELELIRKDLNHHIMRTDLLTQRIDINESYMNKMMENQFKQNESLLEGVKAANKQTSNAIVKLIVTSAAIVGALQAWLHWIIFGSK